MKTYVVPDRGLGAIRKLHAEEVDSELIADLFKESDASALDLAVVVVSDDNSRELFLLFEGSVIGVINKYDRRAYPELDWIIQSGLVPLVTARATPDAMEVRLPRPGLCLPDNNPPTVPWVLLDGDAVYSVELPPQDDDAAPRRRHVLLTLHTTQEGTEEGVVASVDGEVVGHVVNPGTLLESVPSLERRGLQPVVRGFYAPVAGELTLSFRAGEMPAVEDLEISPIPPLPKPELKRAAPVEPQTSMIPVVVVDEEPAPAPEPKAPEAPEAPATGNLPTYQGSVESESLSESETQEEKAKEKSRRGTLAAIVAVIAVALVLIAVLGAAGLLPFGAS
ncbi:hypothetical protein [Corynebacterium lubricantis]|uniref:hypothetical protein n=1 Tax=Corynebacterium lubricantis TaxID=541095 RepID=UPI0003612EEA|nr:hypothetical protein [Corynebacterium lubricantis]